MRILLFTATGQYNLGDELILRAEVVWLRARFSGARILVPTYDRRSALVPEGMVEYIGYFPDRLRTHPLRNLVCFLATLWHVARADLIVIGGGGLIFDTERGVSFRKLVMEWYLRVLPARILRVPVRYVSLGVYVSGDHIPALRRLFVGGDTRACVRDSESAETLRCLGVEPVRIPDSALLTPPAPKSPESVRKHQVGISVRASYIPDEARAIREMVWYIRASGYEVVFLSHSLHPTDPHADDAAFVRGIFTGEEAVRITETLAETLVAYEEVELVVGMRLHSMILSTVYAIPFLPVSYGAKTREYLDSIGYPLRMDARTYTTEAFARDF